MKFRNLTSFKRFFLLGLAIFLCFSLTKNILRLSSTGSRLEDAQKELGRLKNEQAELDRELQKMRLPFYTESQIRNKLGLAKAGEIILVFPEDKLVRRLSPRDPQSGQYTLPDPHWKQWLKLFL